MKLETLSKEQKEDYLEYLVCSVLPHFPRYKGKYELPPVELLALIEATEEQRKEALASVFDNDERTGR